MVSGANRPEYKAGLADDFFLREITPGATVMTIHGVVSEGEIVVTQGQLRLAPGMRVSVPGEGGRPSKTGS